MWLRENADFSCGTPQTAAIYYEKFSNFYVISAGNAQNLVRQNLKYLENEYLF